ncbi:MAG: TRAP transporter substrate-binding protein [Gammaproteobacteria bacterium]|jgi:TRAP-type mannitol/chloroaromatic compound transport system substrate-binding protein|nr:MAG: TRAP transporter substrate-binding protein [Gammaproteobacteria bacterium]
MVVINSTRRRASLVVLCLGLALLGGCGESTATDPAQAGADRPAEAQTFRWKLITTWPKNLPALGTIPERTAERVRLMSNGRLDIRVYGAGELVGAFEVFDAVSQGTAEMGNGASYYWRSKLPIAAIFSTVPFGLTAQEMNGWLHYGGGLELWRELYEPFGLIPMASGNTGVQMGGWFNKEINTLEDLQGLKMRIPGLGGEVLERVGGLPVAMPGSEVFTSLQTGVIDATEWVGPYNDLTFGLHTVADYYYYPGWHEPGATIETIVNAEAWASLPRDLQVILETALRHANDDMLAEFTARNAQALEALISEHRVDVRPFPAAVLAALRTESAAVIEQMAGDNPLHVRILDSHAAYTTSVRRYHEITERAYLNARMED